MNKLHRVLRVRKGFKNTGMQEDNLLSLSYGRIVRKSIDAAEGLLPESFETYQIVEPGNIVMRLTDLQNDKRSLRQALVKERGIITSAYDALELEKGHDPRFWAYALLALDLAKYYYSMGGGVRQSIKFSDFPNDWISTPDSDTQKAIADYLDRETASINQLIEKKQRLGDVIDRRRLAVITAAVAGEIGPAASVTQEKCASDRHIRLRFLLKTAPSAREIKNLTAADNVTFAPMDALDDGLGGLDASMSRTLGEVAAGSYNYFRDGDVLLAKVTPCFENGKKALAQELINGVGFATSEVHVFRPNPGKLNARFLVYLLSSENFRAEAMKSMTGSGGLKRVSDTAILNYRPQIVDVDLQRKVAEFLDCEMGVFEAIKARTKASIERLREYRAALITAAVTGQIDVKAASDRGAANANFDGNKVASTISSASLNADPSQVRRLVAAEIIHDHRNVAYLGRIKVHKIMYLAEAHANINEINGRYRRQAAGPYDSAMIADVEAGLRQDRFYDAAEDASSQRGRITFAPLANAGGHKPTLEAMLGDRMAELRRIIGLVQDFSTENTEAIATLYAVWNDALIDGEQPDDERIIRGFREEWHEAKQRFTEESLRTWLDWMRRNDLVPRGSGPHTISAHQPSLF